ncbi:sensor histidine kinase [Hyalangium rubrum]|uniref:histidine kinase n=1 Tax=Hyalangium rubrum TaxID=3103134 RepID=A0ABU5GYG8_9BACT|nr:ATP-binding protein [Hyalangium sp. s54d21]MDY7225924.1 ATP-binding protein [Hyalangium sp. s54d21]
MSEPSSANPPEKMAELAVRRRNFLICAAVFASSVVTHPVLFGALRVPVAAVQLAWAASFGLLGVLVGSGRLPLPLAGMAAGLLSITALTLEVLLSGGIHSPFFATFYIVPLVMAVFVPARRSPVLVSIAVTLGALVLVCVLSGAPTRFTISQIIVFSFSAVVSAYGTRTYQRLLAAERQANQERLKALEQLAESERHRLHAERHRAEVERWALVGQLASGVAHEVNNPLAFVKANLCFLQEELVELREPQNRDELRTVLEETQQGVSRIQQIVADLRQFSREISAGEECAVSEALDEALRLGAARLSGVGEVVREVSSDLPKVQMGQRHLAQVLLTLLVNAADAVRSAQPQRPAHIVLRARPDSGGVRLELEDNGTGIPQEVMPRLFEPFFTTKSRDKGTGLGLALCREYLSRAGGALSAENRPEGGARFTLLLKAAKSQPVASV